MLFETSVGFSQLAHFVKCRQTLLELNSERNMQVQKEKEKFVVVCLLLLGCFLFCCLYEILKSLTTSDSCYAY